jgi:hypothetical protein
LVDVWTVHAGHGLPASNVPSATLSDGVHIGVGVVDAVPVGVAVGVLVGVNVGVAVGVGVPKGPSGSGQTNAPRPRVHKDRVVLPRSICISQIITAGKPFANRCQTGVAAFTSLV